MAKDNGIDSDFNWPQATTGELKKAAPITTEPPKVIPMKKPKNLVLIILTITTFAIGSASCYFLFPRYIRAVGESKLPQTHTDPLPNTDKKTLADLPKFDENKANRRLMEKIFQELEDSGLLSGTLEIKDFEATTVRYNKAVFKNKDGSFTDLKNKVAYPIYIYFVDKDSGIGHGIVGDNQKNLFRLVWYSEKIKIPATNPKTIYVPSGRRIEIGSP